MSSFLHFHVRIHRWVVWWICIGVLCGAVAFVNILSRNLSHTQETFIILVGVYHWVLGGLICYAFDGISIQAKPRPMKTEHPPGTPEQREWHPASDFLLTGNHKSHLTPKY
jgi:hypothetical protein